MANNPLEQLLTGGMSIPLQRVNRRQIAAILEFYGAGSRTLVGDEGRLRKALLDALADWLSTQQRQLALLRAQHNEFTARMSGTSVDRDIRGHVIDYARTLGAGPRQLRGDRSAFNRWFGADAVIERYQKQCADCERHLSFTLERLGVLGAAHVGAAGDTDTAFERWRQFNLDTNFGDLIAYEGDPRVRFAALEALTRVIVALPAIHHANALGANLSNYIHRLAMDRKQPVWLQTKALELLSGMGHPKVMEIVARRLTHTEAGDDFFVRECAVGIMGAHGAAAELTPLLAVAFRDPSPTVRQALIDLLIRVRPPELAQLFPEFALADPAREVRGYAIHALIRLAEEDAGALTFIQTLAEQGVQRETAPVTLRLYCHIIPAIAAVLLNQGRHPDLGHWTDAGFAMLTQLHTTATDLRVRRWAAQARETLWCIAEPQARGLRESLHARLDATPAGKRVRLKRPAQAPDDYLGRVLSTLTQQDFGLDVTAGSGKLSVRRWERFRFRLWRAWHELSHSSPEKRQAGDHMIGRVYSGLLQVPSARMAELSPTKVPGEPLHMSDEDGWRPYLPLVDQVISSLDQGWPTRPMKLYTSEGVTEIMPPKGLVARLRARLKLTFGFARYARLRNWDAGGTAAANGYIAALRELGFGVGFRTHTDPAAQSLPADPMVQRFFHTAAVPVFLWSWWQAYTDYFVSVYQNTIHQLTIFLGGILVLFLGRHIYVNQATRRARNQIPLVIGGWGTRGKSGTERLKAALFNGLGFHVISKTTGCEAMFLHGYSHSELREMFLFRPYDKATIWEQANLVRLSQKLDVDVFLWECMGLTPSYVRILQKQWMRDDISTITNTYPDHEDIQGPAGINIPIVMTEFIPRDSTLITSEAEMLPILQQAAQKFGTSCHPVSWIEPELLPRDTLDRFPYEEHPTNIALVLRMAQEFDIPRLPALKAMADHVVLDLGVLKVYPMAQARGRKLQFTNGMSANERLGALGNWTRLGFDRQDSEAEPGVWITTVINNRSDRVARSRVFADVLVNDIAADRHFLIGTNLEGLMGYVEESWKARREMTTLWPQSKADPDPRDEWRQMALRLRAPTSEQAVLGRLSAALAGLGVAHEAGSLAQCLADPRDYLKGLGQEVLDSHLDAILDHHGKYHAQWREFQELYERIPPDSAASGPLDEAARDLLGKWFRSSIEIVHSPYVSGEELVNLICEQTPPGYTNRIMGMQNIKGPGLDWVYRWQAWDSIHAAGRQIFHGGRVEANRAIQFLAGFSEYGLLSAEYMRDLLSRAPGLQVAQSESFQAALRLIGMNLEARLKPAAQATSAADQPASGVWLKLLTWTESFLDVGDAVRRRRTADRIYRDMVTRRISTSRAAEELQYLNKRQKGGWFIRRITRPGG
jgi:poly-gamma-glutamate synthase PgsB/CapB